VKLTSVLALLLLAFGGHAWADVDPALREDGVLYFGDNLPHRVIGTVKTPTTLYLHRNFQMPLASLFAGQKIEIVGAAPQGYLITGVYRNNSVSGWITAEDLPPDVDRGLVAQAQKAQAHREAIANVIAHRQVIRGMTADEVRQSLGAPDQTSSRTDAAGESQTWTYTAYQDVWQTSYVPGPFGRPTLQTYSVRTPVGQTVVSFSNGVVTAVEQRQTVPGAAAGIDSGN